MENNGNSGTGWIKLHRKLFENSAYNAEPFCKMMAWVDLLLLANHKPGVFYVRGQRVEVKRGQLGYAQESLSKRWKWSRGKVNRYLIELEKSGQIVQQKNRITTVISILNFDKYQSDSTTDNTTDGQQTVQQTNINKNEKNEKNEKKREGKAFTPPGIDEVKEYMRSLGMGPIQADLHSRKFVSNFASKGWRIGNSQMVDWKPRAETWVIEEKEKEILKDKANNNNNQYGYGPKLKILNDDVDDEEAKKKAYWDKMRTAL